MANPELRQMLARGETFFAPAVWNPATARLAWDLGFKALSVPASVAGVALGDSEAMLTATQIVTLAEKALEAVSDELPMIVDAMSGFGNPNHVRLTVKSLESAGVSAAQIGDAIKLPDVADKLLSQGAAQPIGLNPEQTTKFIQREIARWTELIERAGIKAE